MSEKKPTLKFVCLIVVVFTNHIEFSPLNSDWVRERENKFITPGLNSIPTSIHIGDKLCEMSGAGFTSLT